MSLEPICDCISQIVYRNRCLNKDVKSGKVGLNFTMIRETRKFQKLISKQRHTRMSYLGTQFWFSQRQSLSSEHFHWTDYTAMAFSLWCFKDSKFLQIIKYERKKKLSSLIKMVIPFNFLKTYIVFPFDVTYSF